MFLSAQSFSHHSGSIHHPQPSSTPTGNQPPPQHTAPSPGHTQVKVPTFIESPTHQSLEVEVIMNFYVSRSPSQSSQSGPQPQSMFHSGGLSAPTPPNLPPGHSSPQASYTMQGYSLPTHQPLPHGFPSISQLTQVSTNTCKGLDLSGVDTFSYAVLFVLCRLTSQEACLDLITLQVMGCPPSCCTTSPLSRAAAPTPNRGRHNTSTSDPTKVNTEPGHGRLRSRKNS